MATNKEIIEVGDGSYFLSAINQREQSVIYYMESGSKHKVKYELVFELTGADSRVDNTYIFLDTVSFSTGLFIGHIFTKRVTDDFNLAYSRS
jgi:hypothetical protein